MIVVVVMKLPTVWVQSLHGLQTGEPPASLARFTAVRCKYVISWSLKIFPLYFQFTTLTGVALSLHPFIAIEENIFPVRLLGTDTKELGELARSQGRPGGKLCPNVGNWNFILVITESQLIFTDKSKNSNLITNETWDKWRFTEDKLRISIICPGTWLTDWLLTGSLSSSSNKIFNNITNFPISTLYSIPWHYFDKYFFCI